MGVPLVVLAVPSAVLGFVVYAGGFAARLTPPATGTRDLAGLDWTTIASLALVALGGLGAWWVWRFGEDVAPVLLADAFHFDTFQRAVVVRPVLALASTVRRIDESIVDGAVESTGRGAYGLGGLTARWHRASLPRAVAAVLSGALLLGLAVGVWLR